MSVITGIFFDLCQWELVAQGLCRSQKVYIAQKKTFPEMEFKEFELRFKSAKTRFKLSAGLNLKTFDTILSGTNHI